MIILEFLVCGSIELYNIILRDVSNTFFFLNGKAMHLFQQMKINVSDCNNNS